MENKSYAQKNNFKKPTASGFRNNSPFASTPRSSYADERPRSTSNRSDRNSGGFKKNFQSRSNSGGFRRNSDSNKEFGGRNDSDKNFSSRNDGDKGNFDLRGGDRDFSSRSEGNRGFGSRNSNFSRNSSSRSHGGGGRGRFQKQAKKPTGINWTYYVRKAENVEPETPYNFDKKFEEFDLDIQIKKNLEILGFDYPTKIQVEILPNILIGKDVLGIAQTGSGKTGAFLIPIAEKLLENKKNKCLVIVPTRELANQIQEEFKKITAKTRLRSVLVIGGNSIYRQKVFLRNNPEIVIGTPGRLQDVFNQKFIDLKSFNMVVLDEVDRMLDMGFIEDIKFIVSKLGAPRQSMFFSATMDKTAETIANELLSEPVKVQLYTVESHKNVDQDIVKVTSHTEKIDVLHDLLIKKDFTKVLVFSKTKQGADRLSKELTYRGFKVDAIHGDKSQFKRQKAVDRFKLNEINILVATDVVARGIDIKDITHVINYDEPSTYEDYIHRIGRTGRIGKKGVALTFVMDKRNG